MANYTFSPTKSGTVEIFENGRRIATTTPELAKSYGYGGAPTGVQTNTQVSLPPLSQSVAPTSNISGQIEAAPDNLVTFKRALDKTMDLAQGKRSDLQRQFMGQFQGTVAASDFNSLFNQMNQGGSRYAEGLAKSALEGDSSGNKFKTEQVGSNLYQYEIDSRGKIVGKPQLVLGGGDTGFGSGGIGGILSTAPGTANSQYQGAIDTILGSGKFTKDQTARVVNSIRNGEDPATVIKNQAKNIMGQTEANKVANFEIAKAQVQDIGTLLKEFYARGGTTGFFTGNIEKTINRLGNVQKPELVEIATQIAAALQIYRNAVSGTAYSVQEGADIAAIFPGINKSQGLNTAILNGRLKAFDSTIDAAYRSALGTAYDSLKSADITMPSTAQAPLSNDAAYAEYLKATGQSSIAPQVPQTQAPRITLSTAETLMGGGFGSTALSTPATGFLSSIFR